MLESSEKLTQLITKYAEIKVTTDKSSKSAPKKTNGSVPKGIPDAASISAFMAQVTDLIK